MAFIKRVIEELDFQGKTQSQLAEYLGVNKAAISMWIKRDSIPAADTAYKVAQFLGVSLEYLLTGEKKEEAPKTPFIPLPKDISRQDLSDIRYFIEVYPSLMPSEKQMVMACLGAAEKPAAESSLNTA